MIAKVFGTVLVAGMGLLASVPANAADHTARLPRIAVLWPGAVDEWVKAFRDGLREAGYVDGETVTIDARATKGNVAAGERMAEELIARDPDVVFAVPGMLAKDVADAEKKLGKPIPVVFVTQDPVIEGLVASVARPGGHMTGFGGVTASGELMTKHLQLLKEMLPRLKRVALLIDTSWKDFSLQSKEALEKAGPEIGVKVSSISLQGSDDIERALSEVLRSRAEAIIVPLTPAALVARNHILAFASKHRLPAAYAEEVFTREGGLVSYGFAVSEKYHQAAGVVAKVLRGARPADIPIDYSMRFELVVNLKTAKALGITIPESIVLRADRVIR
jgi:putative ABC transport system substrate-binding protein